MSESHVGFFSPTGCIVDIALNLRWDGTQFAREVARRAAVLSGLNVHRGSIVGILHNGSAHFFADLFAVWRLGAAAACLDSALTDQELGLIVGFAKPEVLLVDRLSVPRVGSVPVLELNTTFPSDASAPVVAASPDDRALVLFTSGTTGEPKGVVLSFRALSARLLSNIDAIGTVNLARTLVTLPTHFGHGLIGNALTPLMAGGDIVLHPRGLFLAQNLGHLMDEHRITFMSSVPALWRGAIRGDPPDGTSLARVHVGSSPLSAKLWSDIAQWSRAEVVNCYGMTETANWIAGASSRSEGIAEGLLGKPWGCTVAVLSDDGTIRKSGEGELLVKSPAVMSGYLARPDLTEKVLSDGWLHTGDRGRVDNQGRIWFCGRIKEQIDRAGFKIQPAEIDALLERHPAIAEACAFGIPDPASGESVAAAVRFSNGASASPKSLQSWCLRYLRPEAVPERWYIVDSIPRTAVGKVRRDVVRSTLIGSITKTDNDQEKITVTVTADTQATMDAGVADSLRKIVARAWVAVLGDATIDLPWAAGGGDSISTLRLWFHLEQDLGVRLPLDIIKPSATLNELSVAIAKVLTSQTSPLPHPASDQSPVVFFLPAAGGDVPFYVRFRAALANKIRFAVINYPSWREIIRKGGGFDTMVEHAFTQIRAQSDSDIYFLAGHCFGGVVAYEVARRLVRSGGRIGFLGLIDARAKGRPPQPPAQPPEAPLSKSIRRLGRIIKQPLQASRIYLRILALRIIASLASRSAYRSLIVIDQLSKTLPRKVAFECNWHLTEQVNTEALRKWTIEPQDISAILFRSDEEWYPPDCGWSALCSRLAMVDVQGDHDSLFRPPNLERFCAEFLKMVETASSSVNSFDRIATAGPSAGVNALAPGGHG